MAAGRHVHGAVALGKGRVGAGGVQAGEHLSVAAEAYAYRLFHKREKIFEDEKRRAWPAGNLSEDILPGKH